ncbi:MAG TPA: hypothetical protein VMH20_16435 [Verrucomicrobiae bacterium]|nr:hypothetical protein [Verrucomicrobiae bacterium]
MNVSAKADQQFMRELQRTDPQRYHNLIRNMQHAAARQSAQKNQEQAVAMPKAA